MKPPVSLLAKVARGPAPEPPADTRLLHAEGEVKETVIDIVSSDSAPVPTAAVPPDPLEDLLKEAERALGGDRDVPRDVPEHPDLPSEDVVREEAEAEAMRKEEDRRRRREAKEARKAKRREEKRRLRAERRRLEEEADAEALRAAERAAEEKRACEERVAESGPRTVLMVVKATKGAESDDEVARELTHTYLPTHLHATPTHTGTRDVERQRRHCLSTG